MIPGLFSALLAAGLHAGEIAVRSDASVELAGAAQLFCPAESDPEDYRRPVGEELELVRARFPKGRCVPARKGFSFSARAAAILALGPRPEFSPRRETAKEAEDAAGGAKAFEAWIADLRAFARGEAKVEAHIVPEAVAAV